MGGFTAIVDYGMGNLQSVTNALKFLGLASEITDDSVQMERAARIILPGVGAFPDAADRLRERGLDEVLRRQAEKKPLLGICLGMQLLFEESDEGRPVPGLGLIPGRVEKIRTEYKLPQIGWNSLSFRRESPLLRGVAPGAYVYFVHTYCCRPRDPADILATADYGEEVVASAGRGNVFGCQFHPEKSGEPGLTILRNFGEMNR